MLSSTLKALVGPFLAITTILNSKVLLLGCLLFSVFKLSGVKILEGFDLMYDQFHDVDSRNKG